MESIKNNFDNPQVYKLLINHFTELRSVSPKGSTHVLDIEGLKHKSIQFWSFWKNNKLFGCGAIKFLEKGHGEFKSIRVAEDFRGKGKSKEIIKFLLIQAKKNNILKISVETGSGDFFLPARKLFIGHGFKYCLPFAHYADDPNSCYFNIIL